MFAPYNNNQIFSTMQTITKVVVSNYNEPNLNVQFMEDTLNAEIQDVEHPALPQYLYASVAYIDVKKATSNRKTVFGKPVKAFDTVLVLSIKGRAYKYTLQHSNEDFYLANAGLRTNNYPAEAPKLNHKHVLQQAFEQVVFMRSGKIINHLIANI